MLHKHFKRARREWNVIVEDPVSFDDADCDLVLGQWARCHGAALIKEVERLRAELKSRNRKKRAVHARLALEQDDHDDLLKDVHKLKAWINGYDVLAQRVLHERIDEMLEPYIEDHDADNDD